MMERRNAIIAGFVGVGILGIAFALFSPQSDEEIISAQLQGVANALGFSEPISNPIFFGSALSDRLEPYVTDPLEVVVSEVQRSLPRQRAQLAMASALALSRYGSFDLELSELTIEVSATGARVQATANVAALDGGTPRMDSRRVHFELIKDSGTFLVSSVRVEPGRPD